MTLLLGACGGEPAGAHDAAVASDPDLRAPPVDGGPALDAMEPPDASGPPPDAAVGPGPDFGAGLTIVQSPITYSATRKSEMATYSKNH